MLRRAAIFDLTMSKETTRGVALVLLTGVVFSVAALAEVPLVNGPYYWKWSWRTLRFDRAVTSLLPALLFYAYLVRKWSAQTALSESKALRMVACLFLCSLLLQLASLYIDVRGLSAIKQVVKSPVATSYYSDAIRIRGLAKWLPGYATATLRLHSTTHPPGPILYYYGFIQLVGTKRAALVGGACIGALASTGVILLYWFGALWSKDRRARLGPCFLYVLMPSLIVFLPEFDQLYPVGAMAMLMLWHKTFDKPHMGIALGCVVFVASLMAYNFAMMAVPMLFYAGLRIHRARWTQDAFHQFFVGSAITLLTLLVLHWVLYWKTSYHAIDSFMRAFEAQKQIALSLKRPYWTAVFFDLYDMLLVSGWMTLPLLVLSLQRPAYAKHAHELPKPPDRAVTVLLLLAVVAVVMTGVLRGEAARVLLFLQPLIIVPAGMQLTRWDASERALVLGLQAFVLIVIHCKMTFI